ncbi:MAG: NAD-glutamate dehydrogenase [Deltaproteobacteria bacterium]|nr:NAD-glutamate dehydrogenase [Deltaproteobacteria bacterium]
MVAESLRKILASRYQRAQENLRWLSANMHPYFFITMKEDADAIVHLAGKLHQISSERKITLTDRDDKLILARADIPGSLYDTLKSLREREISYAEMSHSYSPIPGSDRTLEIQRFEFNRKGQEEIHGAGEIDIPPKIRDSVLSMMRSLYPGFDFDAFDAMLKLLWLNNEEYVRISPPERIARVLHLYQEGKRHDGLYLDVETKEDADRHRESRLLFSVGNPPQREFLTQVGEIFQRLDIGVRRSYCLIINTGIHPYFLGTFYVLTHGGELVEKGGSLFGKLQTELYNTQILSTESPAYTSFVANRIMTGEEASLTDAFIAFCHTALAHSQPDRFGKGFVREAFHSEPNLTLMLIDLFRKRFDPDIKKRKGLYDRALQETENVLSVYNTGHRYLDEARRTVFRTCLLFIKHTLKTNFFVPEKHALAFRLAPAFLSELGPDFTSDLPEATPFRITFFFTRQAQGYHVGFSDIARGGWRTIICRTQDEHTTNTRSIFREVFVLAHTQHLKNKDIYQGGSKLTIVMDATDLDEPLPVTQRLYKVQYGVINAFLDLFVTEKGKAKSPRVVDYYGEEEPIELGPDENMHDAMIEFIARQAQKRGYVLGIGIMSSKEVGINHKEYGVTSRGVVKFAETAMQETGIRISSDPFSVKFTGGPNGDVAGNAMRLLLERCPRVEIRCVIDGTAGLYDPRGAKRDEMNRILLREDLEGFDPKALNPGGFILFRHERRQEGLRTLYRKVSKSGSKARDEWITADEFNREMDNLLYSVPADLFLPCGGRPETLDHTNWDRILDAEGKPSVHVIVEGANSFISPEARLELQKQGVVILRDASANKCGVISSSYEIIANLLMTQAEFLEHKETYVRDVLSILEQRAEEEAGLIFERRRRGDAARPQPYTEISAAISTEINAGYSKLFDFFRERAELADQPLFRKVMLNHLPAMIQTEQRFSRRLKQLPPKIKFAILASEIATMIVYQGGWELDFESRLREYLKSKFA